MSNLTKADCIAILEEYDTPKHVILHCNAVGDTARALARSLNKKGLELDVDLVASAGYLHDIARVYKKHEEVGADYLYSIGLKDVSNIIRNHTHRDINMDIKKFTEEDLLCIADRLVLEDRYVGPKVRMDYIKSKAILKFGPDSEKILDDLIVQFVNFVEELESFIGERIVDIIPEDIR